MSLGIRTPAWIEMRARAGSAVAREIRAGRLPRANTRRCVDCEKPAQAYDHRDYEKPIDVEPVCRSCNGQRGPAKPLSDKIPKAFNTSKRYQCLLGFRVTSGERRAIKAAARRAGARTGSFIRQAIQEKLERDRAA